MEEKAAESSGGRSAFLLVIALFFVSGLTSLIYQVIWTRQLVFVFGSTTFASSSVLTVFMGGLALGSFATARFVDKIKRPFLWYGILEGIIGVWAVLAPTMFDSAIPIYQAIWRSFHLSLLPFSLLRFLVTACILLPPTTCMGATLPLLSRFVTNSLASVGSRVGTLYAVNTLGAVCGSLIAGFYLLPQLGLNATTVVAAAGNVILCAAVLSSARQLERQVGAGSEVEAAPEQSGGKLPLPVVAAMTAFAFSGAIAMIYEVAWTRTLLMVIGSTTYAFTTMLSTFLVGIFLGSLVAARFVDRARAPLVWFAVIQLCLCLSGLAAIFMFNYVPYWNLVISAPFLHSPLATQVVRFLLSALVLLPVTLFLGAVFPFVVKICTKDLSLVGRSVGSLYSANTLGAIVGAFLAGFVVIPLVGSEKALLYASLVNLFIGCALICLSDTLSRNFKVCVAGFSALLVVAACMQPDFWDHLLLISAQKQRRSLLTVSASQLSLSSFSSWAGALHDSREMLFWKDGTCATVGVIENIGTHVRSLLTSGHVDASNFGDMDNQILLAMYPLLFHPHPKEVAVVGWGSGVSVGSAAFFPAETITCIEIEPAVLEAAKFFNDVNHKPENDRRVKIELNDGRNYLLATDKLFDVIVSQPSNPWQAGVCNLFTKEYFKICKDKLKEGGVFGLWLQINEVSTDNMLSVLSALQSVFPYTLPFESAEGDIIVIGSNAPIKVDYDKFARIMSAQPFKSEFKRAGVDSIDGMLTQIVASSEAVSRFTRNIKPNSDDRNMLEYGVARTYENEMFNNENHRFLAAHAGDVTGNISWGALDKDKRAAALARVAQLSLEKHPLYQEGAIQWANYSLAESENASALQTRGFAQISLGHEKEGLADLARSLAVSSSDFDSLLAMASGYMKTGHLKEARETFARALTLRPASLEALQGYAQSLLPSVRGVLSVPPKDAIADKPEEALQCLAKLPQDKDYLSRHKIILRMEAAARRQKNEYAQAEKLLMAYLALDRENIMAWRELAAVYNGQGKKEKMSQSLAQADQLKKRLSAALVAQARDCLERNQLALANSCIANALVLDGANSDAQAMSKALHRANPNH